MKSLLAAAAVAAAAGLVVAAATVPRLPDLSRAGEIAARPVPVSAAASRDVCPGPAVLTSGAVAGTDPALDAGDRTMPTRVRGAALAFSTGVLPESAFTALGALAGTPAADARPSGTPTRGAEPPVAALETQDPPVQEPRVWRSPARGQEVARSAAVQLSRATSGDLTGTAAVDCAPPRTETWLVGGATTAGRSSRLVLTNASETPSRVDVALWTDTGPVAGPDTQGLLVPAGRQTALLLEGLAPDARQLAVHVTAHGAPVAAALQHSVLRGLDPGGVDFVPATRPPARTATLTGLVVGRAQGLPATGDRSDARSVVRIAAPGREDAVVALRVLGPDGPVSFERGAVTVPAGRVVDVPLDSLPDGVYGVQLSGDQPVVAGAEIVRAPAAPDAGQPAGTTELGWTAAGGVLSGRRLVPVPDAGRLVLTGGRHATTVQLRAVSADGTPGPARRVSLSASTTAEVSLDSLPGGPAQDGPRPAAVLLDAAADSGVVAAVVLGDPGGERPSFSILPVEPAATHREAPRVRVVP